MNLKALVSTLVAVISILPQLNQLVDNAVTSVEAAFPDASGSDKLKAAEAKVGAWLTDLGADVGFITTVTPILKTFIAGSVAAFNVLGLFTHKPAAKATGS